MIDILPKNHIERAGVLAILGLTVLGLILTFILPSNIVFEWVMSLYIIGLTIIALVVTVLRLMDGKSWTLKGRDGIWELWEHTKTKERRRCQGYNFVSQEAQDWLDGKTDQVPNPVGESVPDK